MVAGGEHGGAGEGADGLAGASGRAVADQLQALEQTEAADLSDDLVPPGQLFQASAQLLAAR